MSTFPVVETGPLERSWPGEVEEPLDQYKLARRSQLARSWATRNVPASLDFPRHFPRSTRFDVARSSDVALGRRISGGFEWPALIGPAGSLRKGTDPDVPAPGGPAKRSWLGRRGPT